MSARAADGSGTNIVSPTEVSPSSTDNELTFSFTSSEVMDSGGIRITVPGGGWSAPQSNSGIAGYTTASSSGVIGNVKNDLNTSTGWAVTKHMTLSADTGDKQEGSASLSNEITSYAAANEQWYYDNSTMNWGSSASGNLRVGMWLKSSVATAAGNFSWQDDNSAALGSPTDTVSIAALPANTWEYTSVTLGATSRTTINSYGFRYTNDIGPVTLKADDISVIFQSNDSNGGWTGDGGISDSLITGAGNFMEGTGAVRCTYGGPAGTGTSGDCWNNEGGVITVGPGTTVSFWIRSSVALNAGDFAWVDDNASNLGSADDVVDIPALAANTWTYVTLNAPNSGDMRSFGVRQIVDVDPVTIDIDAIGKVIDTCDSTVNWNAPTSSVQTLAVDNAVFHEGGASLRNTIASNAASGDKWYESLGAPEDWSGYTDVGFWIRSTVGTSAGQLKFEYASSSDLTSPAASINIGALSANTWVYQKLSLSGTRNSISSYGINYSTDIGAATIYLDDILLGPGTPTFGGNNIDVRLLSLPSSGTVTVLYGSGGGASGATAPASTGTYAFNTFSKPSDSGALAAIGSSPSVDVVIPPATKFVIDNPTDGTVDAPITITIRAVNANDITDINYQNDVTLVASDSATGEGLVSIVNGVGTLDLSNTVAETVDLSLSDTEGTGLNVSSTQDVVFFPGAVSALDISDPGSVTVGDRIGYTVTRSDQYGNITTTGATTVYLYSSSTGPNKKFYDDGVAGSEITFIEIPSAASSADFWYYDELAGNWTITVSDNSSAPDGTAGIDDDTDNILVNAGSASEFSITDPGDAAAGVRTGYTVSRSDSFDNPSSSGPVTVYLYSSSTGTNRFYDAPSGGNIVSSVVIGDGSSAQDFWYYDELAGNWTITVSDNSSAPDGNAGIDDASDPIVISPAAVGKYLLNDPGNMTEDTRLGYTVSRRDDFDNVVTNGDSTVYLYGVGGGSFFDAAVDGNAITQVTIMGGSSSANFWYFNDTAGNYAVTASDNPSSPDGTTGIDDATDPVTVDPAPVVPTKFVIDDPADGVVGDSIVITVRAVDDALSVDTTFQEDVTLVASGSATGEGIVNIVNGVGTLNISDTVAETVNLSLADTQGTGLDVSSTQSVVFATGPVASFSLNAPANISAGDRAAYTVTRKDQYGNLVTSGATTVYLYSNSTGTTEAFYDAASGGSEITSVMVLAGSSSVDFWYFDGEAGSWTVTASDNDTAPDGNNGIDDGTDDITVSPGSLAKFILDDPGDVFAGSRIGYTVSRADAFGNLISTGSTSIYLYSSSTGPAKAFYDAASGGIVITSVIVGPGDFSANFWYYDELSGVWNITASDNSSAPDGTAGIDDDTDPVIVSNVPIVPTKFVIQQPDNALVGENITVTVRAEDNDGNVDTTYQSDVTLVASGSAVGAGLVNIINGVGTKVLTNDSAGTVTLSLTDSEATGLNVSSTRSVSWLSAFAVGSPATLGPSLVFGTVRFSGRAFPEARISITAFGAQTIPVGQSTASSDGSFDISFSGVLPGAVSYGLVVTDKEGTGSQTKVYNLEVPESDSVSVTDILIPPTIGFLRGAVARGDNLVITGYGVPQSSIRLFVGDIQSSESARTDDAGRYRIVLNTVNMALGSHEFRVRETTPQGVESDFSVRRSAVVSQLFTPSADLNGDDKVDISDWSIFLAEYGSPGGAGGSLDLNGDGKVDITDFSIFIRTIRR
jgi:hypothetical protein